MRTYMFTNFSLSRTAPVKNNTVNRIKPIIPTPFFDCIFTYTSQLAASTYLLFICCTAAAGRLPDTTEMLTPAFSKTRPSCSTQVIPPPPSFRSHRSTLNLASWNKGDTTSFINSLPIRLARREFYLGLSLCHHRI